MKVKAIASFSDSKVGFVHAGQTIDVDAATMKRCGSLVEQVNEPKKNSTAKPIKTEKKKDVAKIDAVDDSIVTPPVND